MKHKSFICGLLISLSCIQGSASEELKLEKETTNSSEIARYLRRSIELKEKNQAQSLTTPNDMIAMALAGETVEKVMITYNLSDQCKIIFKTKTLVFEYSFPRKGKCQNPYN
jgi:hypothetical protein